MNTLQNMLQKVSSFLVLTFCFYQSITVDNFKFGKKLPSTPFMVINNLGMQMCCSECDAYAMCLSVNYNRKLLVCELNNVKENKSGSLITDDDFVYNEMADQSEKVCGSVSCHHYSKCVKTSFNISVCIPMVCGNNEPEIENSFIAVRKYNPPSVTYKCNSGFFDFGDKNTTWCVPGKKWEVPNYKCTQGCPSSWEVYETHQYCYVGRGFEWIDAKMACVRMNAYLIELENPGEATWVSENVTSGEAPVIWIGLAVAVSDGTFYWNHSHTAHGFRGWEPGYPVNPLEQRCAGFDTGSRSLKNFPCNYTMSFMCKKSYG